MGISCKTQKIFPKKDNIIGKYVDVKIHSQKKKDTTNKIKTSPTKQSLYEIISTLKFKTEQVNNMAQRKEPDNQTSFYFQGNHSTGSSKYDLTLAKTLAKKVRDIPFQTISQVSFC